MKRPIDKLNEFDKQGFKFVRMLESVDFVEFINWILMIRKKINQVDITLPSLEMDFSKDEISRAGTRTLINRSKIAMLDDLIIMCNQIKQKYQAFTNGEMEDSNGENEAKADEGKRG